MTNRTEQPGPRSNRQGKAQSSSRPPRLQKVLALAGYGSRRACEQLIVDGRVEVDRQIVVELGTRVDTEKQKVRVDGEAIRIPQYRYFALNKPTGVVTTNRDPANRMRVIDLVPGGEQLFAIGRLDKASSGLILITNDGDFANKLAHPRYGIEKTYKVVVQGHPSQETLAKLRRGVHLSDGRVQVVALRVKSKSKNQTVLQMVLDEGRNREIRRMLASVGHKVQTLQRTAIGTLKLGEIPEGAHRILSAAEVGRLQASASKKASSRRRRPATRGSAEKRSKSNSRSSGHSKNARVSTRGEAKGRSTSRSNRGQAGRATSRR